MTFSKNQNPKTRRSPVAIYHFSAQLIKRSTGRSSVAAAAYRAAERMVDERTGMVHDFTEKDDVLKSTILLPDGAPSQFSDRATLWNAIEAAEKRKDAQTAREINISLPREMSDSDNWKMALDFVQKEFVSRGMIADVAFHRGHGGPNEEQPHIHVMLTTREVGPEGFAQKERAWNKKDLLKEWRKDWAEHCNERLASLGIDMRIDHRTLEEQGINLEPHHYRSGMIDKRTGERFSEYEEKARRNGERLLNDPKIALAAITAQQSTFTSQDVARFINRNSFDVEQFNCVYAKVMAHPELVALGKDNAGRERFSSSEMVKLEKSMVDMALAKSEASSHRVSAKTIDAVVSARNLKGEQELALRHITQNKDLVSVVGFAGTGKSYMLGAAKDIWEAEGYRVQGVALSGIAAESLQAGSDVRSHTIANRLLVWANGREQLGEKDVLLVDEAGMIGSRQMHDILTEADRCGAKVVLVGDPEQLQAIDAGASFRAIIERTGFAEMSDIRRQTEEWQKNATRNFGLKNTKEGLWAYDRHDNIHAFETKSAAINAMIDQWDEVRGQTQDKTQIMLAYRRTEVQSLNEAARDIRLRQGELGPDKSFSTDRGERNFSENDRIYFLKNDNVNMKVKNGSLGVITKIEGERFTVKLDAAQSQMSTGADREARSVSFDLKDYNHIDHGYAATVHKSQGITVDRTQVLASRYFDSHATYVAMSRHRDGADIYYSRDEFHGLNDVIRSMSRERTKDLTLDYAHSHNIEPDKNAMKSLSEALGQSQERKPLSTSREERIQTAEERMAKREHEKLIHKDLERIQSSMGLKASLEFEEGESGIYRGIFEVAGRSYGLMDKQNGEAKLIPAQFLATREKGEMMRVEKQMRQGKEQLKAIQPRVNAREQDRGLDLGGR